MGGDGNFFIGILFGFIAGILISLYVSGVKDVENMGGAGKLCYPNMTCDKDLACVQLTDQPSVCSKIEDIIPRDMKPENIP